MPHGEVQLVGGPYDGLRIPTPPPEADLLEVCNQRSAGVIHNYTRREDGKFHYAGTSSVPAPVHDGTGDVG